MDFLILIFLTETFGLFYAASAAISFLIARTLNFIINDKWGFKDSKTSIKRKYIYFITFGVVITILTSLTMLLLVEIINLHYLISKAIIVILFGTINFILNYAITFQMSKELKDIFKK